MVVWVEAWGGVNCFGTAGWVTAGVVGRAWYSGLGGAGLVVRAWYCGLGGAGTAGDVSISYGSARGLVFSCSMDKKPPKGPGQLRVYHVAVDLCDQVEAIIGTARCAASLKDQALRCAHSVLFNIAEGAGHWSPGKKVYHYQLSRGSSWECKAALNRIAHADPSVDIVAADRNATFASVLLTSLIRTCESRMD